MWGYGLEAAKTNIRLGGGAEKSCGGVCFPTSDSRPDAGPAGGVKDGGGGALGQRREERNSKVKKLGGNSNSRFWSRRWEGLASHACVWGMWWKEIKLSDLGNCKVRFVRPTAKLASAPNVYTICLAMPVEALVNVTC